MDINIEKAFSFVKEDPKWGKKLAIGGFLTTLLLLVLCIPFMILPFITSVPLYVAIIATCSVFTVAVMFALVGYPFLVIYNRIHQNEEFLPCWKNFFNIIFAGIKVSIGHFFFILPVMFLFALIWLIFLGAVSLGASVLSIFIIFFGFVLIYTLVGLTTIYALLYPLMCGAFTLDFNVFSFINFKKGWALLKENWLNYLILVLFIVAVCLVFHFAAMALFFTVAGVILIPWLCFYASLVCAELVAQFVNSKIKDRTQD